MREAKAKNYLATLEARDLLEETKEAFHICLALGDIEKATSYAQSYHDIWYTRFFEAVCSIDKHESIDFLEDNKKIWNDVLTYEIKLYCSAILLQQNIVSNYGLCQRLSLTTNDAANLFGEANRLGLKELERSTLLKYLKHFLLSQEMTRLFTFVSLHARPHQIKELCSLPNLPQALHDRLYVNLAYLETLKTFEEASDILSLMQHCTFISSTLRQEIHYRLACKFCATHKVQTDALMDSMDVSRTFFWKSKESMKQCNATTPLMYGYRAAIGVSDKESDTLIRLIEETDAEVSLEDYWHNDALCRIAHETLKVYPEVAEYALSKVKDFSDYAKQLHIELGKEPSKEILYSALSMAVNSIEENYPLLWEELILIAQMSNQVRVHSKILHWSTAIQDLRERYEVLNVLRSKIEIKFETIYTIAKNISPLVPFYCVGACDIYFKKLLKRLQSTPIINEDYLDEDPMPPTIKSHVQMYQHMQNQRRINTDISEFLL